MKLISTEPAPGVTSATFELTAEEMQAFSEMYKAAAWESGSGYKSKLTDFAQAVWDLDFKP